MNRTVEGVILMNTANELLSYYHAEPGDLRRAGAEFARRNPKPAARLELGPEECRTRTWSG